MKTTQDNAKETAKGMSRELLQNSQDINGFLTVADIRPHTQTHYADTQTGENGIADLLSRILRENEAVFPLHVCGIDGKAKTELRPIVIAGAMFTSDILSEVKARFTAGSTRYPLQTVKNYLSTYMHKQGKVGKVQLDGKEDSTRTCPKPRCKWFLAQ